MPAALAVAWLALFGCDSAEDRSTGGEVFEFSELVASVPPAAPEQRFTARDGTTLPYRRYDSVAPVELVLIHGSSAESRYLSAIASAIARAGVASVVTPDLRGHGESPARRGDVDYIDQLEDDLADLIGVLRAEKPGAKVVVGGHSSGGGLALRFAGSPHAMLADGYLLLAPFLQHDAPTTRPDAGGWASPKLGRIIAIAILNGFGVTGLNGVTVLEFNIPDSARTGQETSAYTYRMMTGFNPRSYASDLGALCAPTLVVVGSDDEAFRADAFAPVFAEHAPQSRVEVVPGVKHLGIVTAPSATELAIEWLRAFQTGGVESRCTQGS